MLAVWNPEEDLTRNAIRLGWTNKKTQTYAVRYGLKYKSQKRLLKHKKTLGYPVVSELCRALRNVVRHHRIGSDTSPAQGSSGGGVLQEHIRGNDEVVDVVDYLESPPLRL